MLNSTIQPYCTKSAVKIHSMNLVMLSLLIWFQLHKWQQKQVCSTTIDQHEIRSVSHWYLESFKSYTIEFETVWKPRIGTALFPTTFASNNYRVKPKFHLARHVSIRSTCRAHAFCLCQACEQHGSTHSTRRARLTRQVERVQPMHYDVSSLSNSMARRAQRVECVELCRDVTNQVEFGLKQNDNTYKLFTYNTTDQ